MDEIIGNFITENRQVSGVIFILLSILIFIYNLKREDGFKVENFGFLGWQAFLSSWILTFLLFFLGLDFLFNIF